MKRLKRHQEVIIDLLMSAHGQHYLRLKCARKLLNFNIVQQTAQRKKDFLTIVIGKTGNNIGKLGKKESWYYNSDYQLDDEGPTS